MAESKDRNGGHGWTFYVEMGFVIIGVGAVLAWLGALLYVLFT